MDFAQIHGYRIPMPTPCWFSLQAIRFAARVMANGIPFILVAGAPDPIPCSPLPTQAKGKASHYFCEGVKCGLAQSENHLADLPPPMAVGLK